MFSRMIFCLLSSLQRRLLHSQQTLGLEFPRKKGEKKFLPDNINISYIKKIFTGPQINP